MGVFLKHYTLSIDILDYIPSILKQVNKNEKMAAVSHNREISIKVLLQLNILPGKALIPNSYLNQIYTFFKGA